MAASDPVPNVRIHVPPLLAAMKRCVKLPDGLDDLERLNTAVSALLTDADRDVCDAARAAHSQFKAVPVRLSGLGLLDSSAASHACAPTLLPSARSLAECFRRSCH